MRLGQALRASTSCVRRRPTGEGGTDSRAGSRSRGTTPMESRSSGSSDSDSGEDADGSAADASSADDRPRTKRKGTHFVLLFPSLMYTWYHVILLVPCWKPKCAVLGPYC